MKRSITQAMIVRFKLSLLRDEKSLYTVKKYTSDVSAFFDYVDHVSVDKETVLEYKKYLVSRFKICSVNSKISSLNAFFKYAGWNDLCVKHLKIQRSSFCSSRTELSKNDYYKLVNGAYKSGNIRLALILQTICATGIRVGELPYITVSAVRRGEAVVSSKNKTRTIIIIRSLQRLLLKYIKENRIVSGSVFLTRSGNPVDRCRVWREMKKLCDIVGVPKEKTYPHNLRHLFARCFYEEEKDIVKLADVLGHSSISTTRIYTVSSGREHRRLLENMRLII